jgi:hypothetical protein
MVNDSGALSRALEKPPAGEHSVLRTQLASMSRVVPLHQFAVAAALGWLVVSACAPDVAESPHVSLLQLRRAVEGGDTAATLQYIDVDAIVARLTRDIVAAGRDSFNIPDDDTLRTEFRTRLDSVEAQWRAVLRTQLGISTPAPMTYDSTDADSKGADDGHLAPDPAEDVLAGGVEIVGDGPVRYLGDTALVDRMLRYAHLDTSATLTLALVPVGRAHWRIVAFHNGVALAFALRQRQSAVLERVNKPLRDSIRARVAIRDVTISRERLEEWEQYAVQVQTVLQNRDHEPVVLYSAHLVGPELSLEDTVGQILPQALTLSPMSTRTIVWRRPLRGAHPGVYDVVWRPALYEIEITDAEVGGTPRSRLQLYSTWQDFVRQNPLPTRSSGGVLALRSSVGAAGLASATVTRDVQGGHRSPAP